MYYLMLLILYIQSIMSSGIPRKGSKGEELMRKSQAPPIAVHGGCSVAPTDTPNSRPLPPQHSPMPPPSQHNSNYTGSFDYAASHHQDDGGNDSVENTNTGVLPSRNDDLGRWSSDTSGRSHDYAFAGSTSLTPGNGGYSTGSNAFQAAASSVASGFTDLNRNVILSGTASGLSLSLSLSSGGDRGDGMGGEALAETFGAIDPHVPITAESVATMSAEELVTLFQNQCLGMVEKELEDKEASYATLIEDIQIVQEKVGIFLSLPPPRFHLSL
jgi:hypothetical protein